MARAVQNIIQGYDEQVNGDMARAVQNIIQGYDEQVSVMVTWLELYRILFRAMMNR